MSHFAQVKNGIVQNVIVAEQDFINTLPDSNDWIQTSYNTHGGVHYAPNVRPPVPDGGQAINYNYAGVGYHWDGTGFYEPQPYLSWTLDLGTYTWQSPVPYPTDGNTYVWNEIDKIWDLVVPNSV